MNNAEPISSVIKRRAITTPQKTSLHPITQQWLAQPDDDDFEVTDVEIDTVQKVLPPRFTNIKPNFEILKKITTEKKSLLITGPTGTGKTRMLIEIMAAHLIIEAKKHSFNGEIKINPAVVSRTFRTVTEVLSDIKDEFDYAGPAKVVNLLFDSPILFLDDLGAEKSSEWVKEQLYMVINKRYNWLRPVVITSNMRIKDIAEAYGDRMASRLVEMCDIVKLDGDDYRLKGKK